MADDRYIEVNLSWMNETEHPGAGEAIPTELIDAGWQSCDNRHEDRRSFCRADSPDLIASLRGRSTSSANGWLSRRRVGELRSGLDSNGAPGAQPSCLR